MAVAVRAALTAAALVNAAAPAAEARIAADAAAAKPKSFGVKSLTAPRSVQAGSSFRARGSATLLRPRRAGTGRLTFSLRRSRPTTRSWRLRVTGTSRVRLTRSTRTRRFTKRLAVPRSVPAGPYRLRACVRRGKERAGCRSRVLRVTRRLPGGPATPPGPGPGTGPGQPPTGGPEALQSLRAPLTGENYYFVMADRFKNGTPANDRGGLPDQRLVSGYDPTHKGFYHGGDLQGMRDKIDYIQKLGTTALWLTPSFRNKPVQGPAGTETAGYHGYWITDFTQIDPHLGTNDDLAALVAAAHARGMKVFFDIITNHTADVISYEQPTPYTYKSKDEAPYKTAVGTRFDDRDFAGTGAFPALDPATSFPYTPVNPAGSETPGNVNHKVPAWLNDVRRYHNRGDTTFIGENSQYGDFSGLDDLFTEDQRVVDGMKEIYKQWITDFKIDGFRIDTMKHVNDEFWQDFAPDVLAHAKAEGKDEFLMFGEVFDTTKTSTSHFTTRNKVQAVIDFPFQAAAQRFAAASGPTSALRDFFIGDDWYTDADSNVYQLPTFLGNHDMGRIGRFVRQANEGASDDEIFDRDRLAHELMYFSRGNPVIYYGDEQGFAGDGGDQDARQDMFPSQVASYNDDDLIATDATTAEENFDESHPLYEAIGSLATVTKAHPALRNGPQQSRYSTEGAGIYAFSRLDRAGGREYVVALNNSEQEQTAFIPTSAGRRAGFSRVYGEATPNAETDAGRRLRVDVPPLSTVVYRSDAAIPLSPAAPEIAVEPLPGGEEARDRAEVRAFVDGNSFYDVTFQAKVGDGAWTTIGTDDNDPYRVFHDVAGIAPDTTIQYRATVLDNAGHTRTSEPEQIQVAAPSVALTAPPPNGRVSGRVRLAAVVAPDDNDNSVAFERSVDGGAWAPLGEDASQPAYTLPDDVSDLEAGTPVQYRAVLTYAPGKTATSAARAVTAVESVTTATIHYNRPDGTYPDWGLHLFGAALAPGEDTPNWTEPAPFEGTDGDDAFHEIGIADDEQQVGFIVHGRPPDGDPATKDPANSPDRFFTPIDHPEIWLKAGAPTIYFSPPP